jgi:putative copper resistance protein D
MGLRIAEIHQDTVAHVLRDEPAETTHALRDAFLIGRNDLAAGAQLPGIIRRRLAWLAWTGLLLTVLSGAAWLVLVAGSISDRSLTVVFSPRRTIHSVPVGEAGSVGLDQARRRASGCGPRRRTGLGRPGRRRLWDRGIVHPAADVLHLVAAAAWVGVLLPLALVLGAAAGDAGSLVSVRTLTVRFSTLGVVSVGTLLVPGTINTWYLAGSILALTETDYGRLLLLKIALFLGMVTIAAVNRLRLTPQLVASASARGTRCAFTPQRRD